MGQNLLLGVYLLVPALVLSTGVVHLKSRLAMMGKSSRNIAGRAMVALFSLAAGMALAAFIQVAPGIDWMNYLAQVGQNVVITMP